MKHAPVVLLVLVATSLAASEPRRPKLDVRVSPRVALSPANVVVTARLSGGDELEDFYCPEVEWEWDDGARSVHQADCEPFESGASRIERSFATEHMYRAPGQYTIRITIRHARRRLDTATTYVAVRSAHDSF